MDFAVLNNELTIDPLTRGYSEMSDAEAATDLNTVYRDVNKVTMTGSEVLNALDKTEFLALTDANKLKVWDVLHLGAINPFGREADIFVAVFGAGSASILSLNAARKTTVSRAVELGLGFVKVGYIAQARSM